MVHWDLPGGRELGLAGRREGPFGPLTSSLCSLALHGGRSPRLSRTSLRVWSGEGRGSILYELPVLWTNFVLFRVLDCLYQALQIIVSGGEGRDSVKTLSISKP